MPNQRSALLPPRHFMDGLLLGLGAASLFFGGLLPKPAFWWHGMEADWDAVGADLNDAGLSYGGAGD